MHGSVAPSFHARPRALAPPPWEERVGPYRAHFARGQADREDVTRLRFEVFHLELGEGGPDAEALGRDEDAFDAVCDHLLVREVASGQAVGTYRLLTSEGAAAGPGFYSAQEFDLGRLPAAVLSHGVELGRACVARAHRGRGVLPLLFCGIAAYLLHHGKRSLFGCASCPGLDRQRADRVREALRDEGHWHPSLDVSVQHGFRRAPPPPLARTSGRLDPVPALLRAYLGLGARVCGGPAFDREFGTTDFLVLLDLADVPPAALRRYTS